MQLGCSKFVALGYLPVAVQWNWSPQSLQHAASLLLLLLTSTMPKEKALQQGPQPLKLSATTLANILFLFLILPYKH